VFTSGLGAAFVQGAMQRRITLHVPQAPQSTPRMSDLLRGISLQYNAETLAAATKGWHASLQLGSGSYGAVYKGELEDGSEVAIKVIDLKAVSSSGQDVEMAGFDDEVKTLSKFRHPNLVTLLGWGKEDQQRYLVYELLSGGDAFQRLHACKASHGSKPFLWHERLSVILDSAKGLSHMHNSQPKAFHRDIKSANILLDRYGQAKMADFGLSCTSSGRKGDEYVNVKVVSGTPGYACPIYARTGRVTEASEVYSLGMVMLELLTSLPPAAGNPKGGIIYPILAALQPGKAGDLERCLESLDKHADFPPDMARELAALALRCSNAATEASRPRFVELVQSLRAMTKRFPKPSAEDCWLGRSPVLLEADGANVIQRHTSEAANCSGSTVSPSANGHSTFQVAEAPFFFEVVEAAGLDLGSLPSHIRRLPLAPSGGCNASGQLTAAVGRQHQPELFEAWLSAPELLQCISRTSFEVFWVGGPGGSPSGCSARLLLRGANAVAVDGKVAPRTGEGAALKVGSEVGFPYSSTGELEFFLRLRLAVVDPALSRASPAVAIQATAPLPRAPSVRAAGSSPSRPAPSGWCLKCIHAEGLSPEERESVASELSDFVVAEGVSMSLGRQHQPRKFDSLLANSPGCLSFISRTHMQVEALEAGVKVTNMSLNPVYVNDRDPVFKGETRTLQPEQVLSFARLEGQTHVVFLSLQVQSLPSDTHLEAMNPS